MQSQCQTSEAVFLVTLELISNSRPTIILCRLFKFRLVIRCINHGIVEDPELRATYEVKPTYIHLGYGKSFRLTRESLPLDQSSHRVAVFKARKNWGV